MDPSSSNLFSTRGKASLEVILVVAVLLGLCGTIFTAVASYRKGSARAECVKNIASIQQAVRLYQTNNDLEPGAEIAINDLVGDGKIFAAEPCCPASGKAYTWKSRIPLPGRALVKCPHTADLGHAPSTTNRW